MKRILPFLVFSFSAFQLLAADLYILDGGTGDGSAWDNALDDFPAMTSITRGDTIYVGDGAYTGHTFDKAVSGTTVITIKKAIESDHGTSTGWSSTYGDGQATFSGQIEFASSYWVFDGQTGGGPGSWNSGFGFKITETANANAVIMVGYDVTVANNITIRHVDLQGKGSVSTQGGYASNDGLAIYEDSNTTISYAWMHGIGRCPFFFAGNTNTVMEYIYVESFYGSEGVHSEVMSSGQGGTGDTTLRYSLITMIASTGGLLWDNNSNPAAHFYVYGNVFYRPSAATWESANGIIAGWTGGSGEEFRNCEVYHNTFIDTENGGDVLSAFPNTYSGNIAKNNLFYSVAAVGDVGGVWGVVSHNHFVDTTEEGTSTSTGSGDPFTDFVNFDFSLTADTTAGDSSVSATYRTDMFGNTGTTRGAVQFTAGGGGATPTTLIATNVTVGTLRLR